MTKPVLQYCPMSLHKAESESILVLPVGINMLPSSSIFFQILGIIDQPVLRERWIGISGRKSTLNGQEVATRTCTELSRAYLYVILVFD